MSFVLKQIGKVWHYRFQVNGVRVQKSTRETSRNKAAQVATEAWERAKLTVRSKEPIPTLAGLAQMWLNRNRPIMSGHYIRSVETITNLHLTGFVNTRIDLITTDMVEDARELYLVAHSRHSANTWLNILSVLFHWAIEHNLINQMPWKVRRLKVQKIPRVSLSTPLIAPFLEAVDKHQNYGISAGIRLMLGLGLRESEALTARWEWIDWERKTYTPGKTKGFEAVAIPIAAWLMEWFQATRFDKDELIVFKPYGTQYSAGFASEQGVSVQNIQHAMRHKDSITTMKYLEVYVDEVRRGVNQIAEKSGMAG